MNDELRELEVEAARIKLMREKLSLESEIQRRSRKDEMAETVVGAVTAFKVKSLVVGKIIIAIAVFLFILFCIMAFFITQEEERRAKAEQENFEAEYAEEVRYKEICKEKVIRSLPAGAFVLNWDNLMGSVGETSSGKKVTVYASEVSGDSPLMASCYFNSQDYIIDFQVRRRNKSLESYGVRLQ